MDTDLENDAEKKLDFITRGGFSIAINPLSRTCIVSRSGQVEIYKGSSGARHTDQPIPFFLFVGRHFEILAKIGEYSLLPVKNGRLLLSYKLWPHSETFNLQISCGTMSDQFPVYAEHVETVRQYELEGGEGGYRYVFMAPDVSSYDRMTFKVKYPDYKILLISVPREEKIKFEMEDEQIREDEQESGGERLSTNPVFQASIFLRNFEFEKIKQMLVEYDMTPEEIQIIRTFLQILIRNEGKNPDLDRAQKRLKGLDDLFRLNSILSSSDRSLFEKELDKGFSPQTAGDIIPIVEQMRIKAQSKEDEIAFWEWEYRLGKMTGMQTK